MLALSLAFAGCREARNGSTQHHQGAAGQAHEENLTFERAGLTLVGKLSLPARSANGLAIPVVVMIGGSGPSSADCELPGQAGMTFAFPVPLCADLAAAFVESGVAAFRYDKRSCGKFNRCSDNNYPRPPAEITIDDFVDDVRSAISMLRARPELDPERVFLFGHSEGGTMVPVLLAEDPRLGGGMMSAAPYRDPDYIITEQAQIIRTLMVKSGAGQEQAQAAVEALVLASAQVASLRAGDDSAKVILHAPSSYWRSWLALAARARDSASRIAQPLLVLNGDYDFNVPTTELVLWRDALSHSFASRTITQLPCVTHALNCISQPNPLILRLNDIGNHVHPSVVDALRNFLRSHT